jgi:hypothetical protein
LLCTLYLFFFFFFTYLLLVKHGAWLFLVGESGWELRRWRFDLRRRRMTLYFISLFNASAVHGWDMLRLLLFLFPLALFTRLCRATAHPYRLGRTLAT